MSVRIMTRVFDQSKQKGTNRLALLCLGDNAHEDGLAYPGIGEIARKMGGVSRRSAGRRIEALARTAELGVYPRKGGSHDYIVFTGMTWTQAKQSIRKMMTKRRATLSELNHMRRKFAGEKVAQKPEESRVGATPESQELRHRSRTNHQEPSVKPVVVTTTTTDHKSVFTIWEMEGRTPLTPTIGEELGEMADEFGPVMVGDAIREAVKSTGPGQFNLKYVRKICDRWKREGKQPRPEAGKNGNGARPIQSVNQHPPHVLPPDPAEEALILSPQELAAKARVLVEQQRLAKAAGRPS